MQPIAAQVEPIQIVTMMVILATIIVIITQVRNRRDWLWIPCFAWVLHGILFYICLTIDRAGWLRLDVTYTTWSSVLRLHGFVTALGTELVRLYISKDSKNADVNRDI